ncbi:hypothetical protein EI77_01051 [Prosthecobacter fusiformis]|uniref:P pilus assembly chaperone PapD n=1 Tax=Prosthecobacter fusiformis TaxID=48464 RepID=A0A4R7SRJ4_9BACT|nr:hypothetical protein [Prosthecobacter fusiformis]TDU81741.1 hypothetical protein EI77_01051 [Prosthecobacter fusiformis]
MRFLTPLLFLALTLTAQAQFQVGMTLPRTNFLALEAIPATVTITNRSGAEVVLGGPGRASWLSFEMTDRTGRSLSPIEVSGVELAQIPAGGTIQRKIIVTDAYSPTEIGNYGLTARVAHMPSGQFYTSTRLRFNITDNKPMWEQAYGVPEGFKGAGTARRYAVILFTDVDSTSLYVRLIDDKSNLRLQTFRLGPITMAHDPQISLDRSNSLNVLFLAQPHIYAHCVVAPDGSLKKRSYYREENGDRPQMSIDPNGDVLIRGGDFFDPSKPPPKPANTGRNVSDKPPGLE